MLSDITKEWITEFNIQCAICKKHVDRVEKVYNSLTGRTVYKVYCHGDCLEFPINADELITARKIELREKIEVFNPELPNKPKQITKN